MGKPFFFSRPIQILSLDFDGVVKSPEFEGMAEASEKDLPEFAQRFRFFSQLNPLGTKRWLANLNPQIVNFGKKLSRKSDKFIVLIGSNRQSKRDDTLNVKHHKTVSAFDVFPLLVKSFGTHAQFDPFLLPDADHNLPNGTTYRTIMSDDPKEQERYERQTFADYKAPLLYAQMHKIACDNAGASDIIFNFVDDTPEILNFLWTVYHKHPELIPENVTLKLYHHTKEAKKAPTKWWKLHNDPEIENHQVQGCGSTDVEYKSTIRKLDDQVTLWVDRAKDFPKAIKKAKFSTLNDFTEKYEAHWRSRPRFFRNHNLQQQNITWETILRHAIERNKKVWWGESRTWEVLKSLKLINADGTGVGETANKDFKKAFRLLKQK